MNKQYQHEQKGRESRKNTGKGETFQAADEKLNKFSCKGELSRRRPRLRKNKASRDKTCSFCFIAPTQRYHTLVIGFSNGLLIFYKAVGGAGVGNGMQIKDR